MKNNAFVEQLTKNIVTEAGVEAITEAAAEFLAIGFAALLDAFRKSLVTPTMVDYACRLARGVIADNPTFPPELQRDLVVDGIRLLMQNPDVEWGADQKMSVHALATFALLHAGYVGPAIPTTPIPAP